MECLARKAFLHEEVLQKYTESPSSVSEKVSPAVLKFLPTLLKGALVTVGISILSMMLVVGLGLIMAIMRLYGNTWLQRISTAYIEIYRGTPFLIQLYILYYGLPNIGITLSAFVSGHPWIRHELCRLRSPRFTVQVYSLYTKGKLRQRFLGMSKRLALKQIILPQALRIAIPPMTNDFIALFKDSSLVSVIAIVELTKSYSILASAPMNFFSHWESLQPSFISA